MTQKIEMEFEEKEDLIEAVGETDRPVMVGEISTFYKDQNMVAKTIKVSYLEMVDGLPVIISWRYNVGEEHMLTEDLAKNMSKDAQIQQQKLVEELQKKTNQAKADIAKELQELGYTAYYGILKEFDMK